MADILKDKDGVRANAHYEGCEDYELRTADYMRSLLPSNRGHVRNIDQLLNLIERDAKEGETELFVPWNSGLELHKLKDLGYTLTENKWWRERPGTVIGTLISW